MLSSRMAGTGFSMPRLAGLPIRAALAHALAAIPGVMEHGLFVGMARDRDYRGPGRRPRRRAA